MSTHRTLLLPKETIEPPQQLNVSSTPYKPGTWLTGAPAMAGAITVTPIVMAKTGMHHFVKNPLLGTLLLAPMTAALLAFSMNYAANWVAYKLENKGRPLDSHAKKSIWQDSLSKSLQMGASFLLLSGVRETLEHALGQSLKTAWGAAHHVGGSICPSEIRAAVMLSMSLTFGIAMGVTTLLVNLYQGKTGVESFKQAGQAFIAGLFAGAVASVDFGNKGLSFVATWAALCLMPAVKLTTRAERHEVASGARNVGTTSKAMLAYMKEVFVCETQDILFNDPSNYVPSSVSNYVAKL